ncbi:MAG: T9SS type A sorting domain-containing protein, partial [Saprospiraceae bacterium]
IYPNPVSEILQVELLDLTNRVNKISLIGIDGKIVLNLRQLTISNLQTVDVSRLSNGLYVLYVETEKGSMYHRVSVMK